MMTQPQDGVQDIPGDDRLRVSAMRTPMQQMSMIEPEDARLTGGTRSLMRRLMGLNVMKTATPRNPAVATALKLKQVQVA